MTDIHEKHSRKIRRMKELKQQSQVQPKKEGSWRAKSITEQRSSSVTFLFLENRYRIIASSNARY